MKIGLLTVHCSTNFGGALQAYGLSCYLDKGEDRIILIDYRFKGFVDVLDKSKGKRFNCRNLLKLIIFYKKIRERQKKFSQFEKDFLPSHSESFNDKEYVLEDKFDICIVGSDQVWNPKHINYDETFFLKNIKTQKRISYAASIGEDILDEKDKLFLKKNIEIFDGISIREENSVSLIKELLPQKNIEFNIDPVFLLDKEKWVTIEKKVKVYDKYVFVYILGENDIYKEIIKDMQKKGYKIVCAQDSLLRFGGNLNLYDIGPREFLFLIRNASYVITNSFHGLSFSIIFQKRVFCLKSKNRNIRLKNLLILFDAEELQVEEFNQYKCTDWERSWEKIFSRSNLIIDKERKKTEIYFAKFGL